MTYITLKCAGLVQKSIAIETNIIPESGQVKNSVHFHYNIDKLPLYYEI